VVTLELVNFVKEALAKGADISATRAQLLQQGWKQEDIEEALRQATGQGADQTIPKPPMNQSSPQMLGQSQPQTAQGNTFFVGLEYIFLYTSVLAIYGASLALLNLGGLKYFAGVPLTLGRAVTAFPITWIIVFFPIFLFLFFLLRRQVTRNREVRNSKWRKVFIYLALLGFILSILGVLIGFVLSTVIGIGLTKIQLVPSIITLLVNAPLTAYLILDVLDEQGSTKRDSLLAGYITILVALALLVGFTL